MNQPELTADQCAVLVDALDEVYPPAEVNVPTEVRALRHWLALRQAQLLRDAA